MVGLQSDARLCDFNNCWATAMGRSCATGDSPAADKKPAAKARGGTTGKASSVSKKTSSTKPPKPKQGKKAPSEERLAKGHVPVWTTPKVKQNFMPDLDTSACQDQHLDDVLMAEDVGETALEDLYDPCEAQEETDSRTDGVDYEDMSDDNLASFEHEYAASAAVPCVKARKADLGLPTKKGWQGTQGPALQLEDED